MAFFTKMGNVKNVMRKRPLLFNSIVYGTFYTSAELAQQSYSLIYQATPRSKQQTQQELQIEPFRGWGAISTTYYAKYDWKQLQRYAIIGCFVTGPILHGWYKWLDRIFRGTRLKVIVIKLFTDQFILTPPLLAIFFISMSCLEGRGDIFHECKVKFVNTFQTSCLYWIPVQFVNFLLIPPALRVVYVSVASFCWINILCYLKRLPLMSEKVHTDD